jgi:RNA polymerase-interacting CarD/CdnL/TRCF family regulator
VIWKESKQQMGYQIGDTVVHSNYGLGKIINIDEKDINGDRFSCYVVNIRDLLIWVKQNSIGEACIRLPTGESECKKLFSILQSPAEALPDDRFDRKTTLSQKLKGGQLSLICEIVRDLIHLKRVKKLNDNDSQILEKATNFLLAEWTFSFAITDRQAQQKLEELLTIPVESIN